MRPRAKAMSEGRLTYTGGKPCSKGHGDERYTKSGFCVTCAKLQVRARTEAGYYREVYEKNGDTIRTRAKAHYEANRERGLEQARQWVKANPEKRRAISHSYKARRRAQEAGGISSGALLAWTQGQPKVCYWCAAKCADDFHVDHYQPLARGGKHEADNLVIACGTCNRRKSARDPYEFAVQVGRLF